VDEYRIELKDVYKGYTYDLDKVIPPEETLRSFRRKLEETGLDILEETVRVDNGRLGVPPFPICFLVPISCLASEPHMLK